MKYFHRNRAISKRLVLYWAPLLTWMAAIFALSSLTPAAIEWATSPVEGLLIEPRDVLGHMIEFGVLAVLAYRLLASYGMRARPYIWIAVLLIAAGYGITDEYHQAFVPGRYASMTDVGYDSLGALLGLLVKEIAVLVMHRRGRGPN